MKLCSYFYILAASTVALIGTNADDNFLARRRGPGDGLRGYSGGYEIDEHRLLNHRNKASSTKSTKAPSTKSTKAPSIKSTKAPRSTKSTKAPSTKSTKVPKSTKSTKAPSTKSTKTPISKSSKALWTKYTKHSPFFF